MRRIQLDNPNRGGILGMSATLAATSFPNRTSPVRRGVWVLEQVLGERIPPPPPDIPELKDEEHPDAKGLTLRQRTEAHTSDPLAPLATGSWTPLALAWKTLMPSDDGARRIMKGPPSIQLGNSPLVRPSPPRTS